MLATESFQQASVSFEASAMRAEGMLLVLPQNPAGLILFAPGSHLENPDLDMLLAVLLNSGLAILLEDFTPLLNFSQEQSKARRYRARAEALSSLLGDRDLPVGLFGSGHAASQALKSAAQGRIPYVAVVAWEGAADMAEADFGHVDAPVLFLSDGSDLMELELNEAAASAICLESKALAEQDPLERACLAADWFLAHMAQA